MMVVLQHDDFIQAMEDASVDLTLFVVGITNRVRTADGCDSYDANKSNTHNCGKMTPEQPINQKTAVHSWAMIMIARQCSPAFTGDYF